MLRLFIMYWVIAESAYENEATEFQRINSRLEIASASLISATVELD